MIVTRSLRVCFVHTLSGMSVFTQTTVHSNFLHSLVKKKQAFSSKGIQRAAQCLLFVVTGILVDLKH
jgi:hypothetical protein